MAYGNKYKAGWASPKNLQGYVYIDQLDYVGAVTNLVLSADSISIAYAFGDWNNPIIGLQTEFEIINDKSDFYELLPLLSAEEGEYKIRIQVIYPTSYSLFEGFLNCDTVTQKLLLRQGIRFAASGFINKLENHHPVSIDTLQYKTFIDIIDEILCTTGANYNIRVNVKIHAEGDTLSAGQTLFNKNGFYTELFWEDNITRTDSLGILKAILTTFDCYIYWWRGCWYIERYEDIFTENVDYVEYTTGVAYSPTDAGSVVSLTNVIGDVHDLTFIGRSQTISIIPGLKTIKVNLQDKRLFNLVVADLKDIQAVTTGIPLPTMRAWLYWNSAEIAFTVANNGKPKNNITNSVNRQLTLPLTTNSHGIYTTFKLTVDDPTTSLNIKFKYVVDEKQILNWSGVWKDYTFTFNWYLRVDPGSFFIDQSEQVWKMIESSEAISLQTIGVGGDSFDPATSSCEVSISIPLGGVNKIVEGLDAGKMKGDYSLVFGLGTETVSTDVAPNFTSPVQAWIGDFIFATTGGSQANVIEGTVNTKFLNKKEISVDLFDCESYNYKNAILRGDTLQIRTEKWGTAVGVSNVIAKGVCWGVSESPVIAMDHTIDGAGTDTFDSVLVGLSPETTYYVRSYYTDELGDTTYGDQKSFGTPAITIGSYYQGGLIAYIFIVGDPGYVSGEVHGIIVADKDQGALTADSNRWCYLTPAIHSVGADDQSIGGISLETGGKGNTLLMLAETTNVGLYAAKVCGDYVVGAYGDWWLPSVEELYALKVLKDNIRFGFTKNWYWTSSELSSSPKFAVAINFGDSSLSHGEWWEKRNKMAVRPIHYF